ncbi:MAG TPA: thioredoxin family protein [Burkholderiaceae bacterium]|nr:thioredoxin family protein [Burkholderiaceae bacterium]
MNEVVLAAPAVARDGDALAVCLCAAWCDTCAAYRATFAALAQRHAGVRFVWLDIEDQEELLGGVEVENFPTVLIAAGDEVRFFGTITPQPETLARLLRAHLQEGARAAGIEPAVTVLLRRLRSG